MISSNRSASTLVAENVKHGGEPWGSPVALDRLQKTFGNVVAVDNVTLDIAAGEFISLLGPSGSGKTTVLMMLAGFENPSAGTILIDGQNVTSVPPHRRGIGMVFQSYALFPHMTVAANIAYPLKLRGMNRTEIDRRVEQVLETVRLPSNSYANRHPGQLSGGQRQRVALARALVYEPKVLLMDEPMGALDKNLREELKLELISLQKRLKLTVVYVTHDQGEALMLSDRVAVMRSGRIEQIASPSMIYNQPESEFVARFLGDANFINVEGRDGQDLLLSGGLRFNYTSFPDEFDDDKWQYLLRPEDIEVSVETEGQLTGTIEQIVFLGSSVRAEVRTEVGLLTAAVKASQLSTLEQGSQVNLSFPEGRSTLVRRDEALHEPG